MMDGKKTLLLSSVYVEPESFKRLQQIAQAERKPLFEELLPEVIKLGLVAYDAKRWPD